MSVVKYREIVLRPDVTLPALSTETPERQYSYLTFLLEWVIGARGLRKDDKLVHLFEWEDVLETFGKKMADKAGVVEPVLPERLTPPDQPLPGASEAKVKAYEEAFETYRKKMEAAAKVYSDAVTEYTKAAHAASVGQSLYVTDAAFIAAREAVKADLDKGVTPDDKGRITLSRAYETKILRHYHAFAQSKAIEANDVPRQADAASRPS